MPKNKDDDGFARDLGYLEAFFEKLENHARTNMPATSGARLAARMKEERERWKEIRALLAGQAPVVASHSREPSAVTTENLPAAGAAPQSNTSTSENGSWTVGSLITKRDLG